MKALVYHGPHDVSLEEVPDPTIERPTDVLVKMTTTNICDSDLHMYEGRMPIEPGTIFGHENLGEVIEVGAHVAQVQVGDRVCLPFNISCGFCKNCESGLTAFCLTVNPGTAGGAYGCAGMGPYPGGQAEYLRVPYGDFNCLRLPEDAQEKEADYVLLSDIFPTGYHATEMAGVQPGDSVVIYGAGPVGLLAAYSAILKSASKVMIVDRHPDGLRLAEKIGAIPIDESRVSPVDQILDLTDGEGADSGCECLGHHAYDPQNHEQADITMNNLIRSVRPTGRIGVVGGFQPEDPKLSEALAQKRQPAFDWSLFLSKGQRIGTGQANVKAYNRRLCNLIEVGKAKPSFLVTHELPLRDGPKAYRHFDAGENGWVKVLLKPAA
ncbi:glutathione-independent formaldehyde dehydrogenase [Candidatus Nitrospira neomarina]|uniref:Glutathione-independent formaldehyde dehydrogenase n=1 Tax=Candidatus Nitrospira neomarina TaxID=3020899 RepID=A0AA96GFP6_9BACT|nr:glutathione-independent formaldehyde dehydrogenase [Candidatus Nitrospira neomarina]WNM60197.1 glutathione-independent formaldehyde dehydrogenase [Candidatus Nitrospira neomarina]